MPSRVTVCYFQDSRPCFLEALEVCVHETGSSILISDGNGPVYLLVSSVSIWYERSWDGEAVRGLFQGYEDWPSQRAENTIPGSLENCQMKVPVILEHLLLRLTLRARRERVESGEIVCISASCSESRCRHLEHNQRLHQFLD